MRLQLDFKESLLARLMAAWVARREYGIYRSSRVLRWVTPRRTQGGSGRNAVIRVLWILTIVSFSFSRKMDLLGGARETYFVKIEDVFLLVIAGISLRRGSEWRASSLDLPILCFVLVCVVSLFRAVLIGTVIPSSTGILYLGKLCEYFAVFYLMYNSIAAAEDARLYLRVCLFVAALIGIYGIWEHFHPYPFDASVYPFIYRIYERGYFYHDANHLAAYLVFMASLTFGLLVHGCPNGIRKTGLLLVFLGLCPPIFWTYSRAAYVSLFCSLLMIASLRSRRFAVYSALLLLWVVLSFSTPSVIERIASIKTSVLSNDPFHSSIAYRIQQMRLASGAISQYPILGIGLGARERVFYENQYLLILSEMGIAGLAAFLYLMIQMFSTAGATFRAAGGDVIRGVAAGCIGGLIGLMVECNTMVVFLVSRVMGPFWVIMGILFWFYAQENRKRTAGGLGGEK